MAHAAAPATIPAKASRKLAHDKVIMLYGRTKKRVLSKSILVLKGGYGHDMRELAFDLSARSSGVGIFVAVNV